MSRYCSNCGRAKKACLCAWITPITTNVELIILQHPTEVDKAKGTAKILTLSLANSRCFVGEDFTHHEELNQLLADTASACYVLFPQQTSISITQISPSQVATKKKMRVILLDGTWKKALKIYRLSANLQHLPSLHLPDDLAGEYRIRKSPSENHLSTLEAGYHLLNHLEPDTNFQPLISAFHSMIDFYIAQMPEDVFRKNYLDK